VYPQQIADFYFTFNKISENISLQPALQTVLGPYKMNIISAEGQNYTKEDNFPTQNRWDQSVKMVLQIEDDNGNPPLLQSGDLHFFAYKCKTFGAS